MFRQLLPYKLLRNRVLAVHVVQAGRSVKRAGRLPRVTRHQMLVVPMQLRYGFLQYDTPHGLILGHVREESLISKRAIALAQLLQRQEIVNYHGMGHA